MAKRIPTTLAERREMLEQELARVTAFETIINKLENDMRWDYCSIKYDEDGNEVHDENGERIWIEPEEGSWRYDSFVSFKSALEEIKSIARIG